MFGPIIMFDKSAFQSLNVDDSVWLDHFYTANITPLFFVETLSDLEKEMTKGKTPEQIVGSLAYKTPEMGCVNIYHKSLIEGELMGWGSVEMKGRPIISQGQVVKLGNETGVIIDEPPEVKAFKRWQNHEFLEIEKSIAKQWRESINKSGSKDIAESLKRFFSFSNIPKDLSELKEMVDEVVKKKEQGEILKLAMILNEISPRAQTIILNRWLSSGSKNIQEFAPYFSYVLSVDLFYYLGCAYGLFSMFPHTQTHKIDVAYLYYLPFCKIFLSNDKFHIGVVPLFLRQDQTFIKGIDFKADLVKLDEYYSNFPEEVKDRGIITFALIPPDDASFLVTRMWDKYMSPKWREIKGKKFDGTDEIDFDVEQVLTNKIDKIINEAIPTNDIVDSDNVESMTIKRMVSSKKGKWAKFPVEIIDSKKRLFH